MHVHVCMYVDTYVRPNQEPPAMDPIAVHFRFLGPYLAGSIWKKTESIRVRGHKPITKRGGDVHSRGTAHWINYSTTFVGWIIVTFGFMCVWWFLKMR